jgi:restriction system protein
MEVFQYKYDDLFNPTLQSLHKLGGSASIPEIEEEVSRILNLSDNEVNDIHRGSVTKLSYRLAWARNYLKRYGAIENSTRGVWALTATGLKLTSVDKEEVKKEVKLLDQRNEVVTVKEDEESIAAEAPKDMTWKEELLDVLKNISPTSFENLCKRFLRESGFINVEVTGRSGDGGIDGKGVVKLGGVLSFHVVFQAKRYKDIVPPSVVRDFRGAMIGRADKGLIITTGTFTRDAKAEAQRAGAPPIDLIDGEELAERLKELSVGVETELETIEKVTINKDWFNNI